MKEIPVQDKYLLTVREASAYFNIGIKHMRKIAEENADSIAVRHGNRYLIIRPKCEEFIIGYLKKKDVQADQK